METQNSEIEKKGCHRQVNIFFLNNTSNGHRLLSGPELQAMVSVGPNLMKGTLLTGERVVETAEREYRCERPRERLQN